MGIRKIVIQGDDVLAKKSREVVSFDKRLHSLLDDMKETLRDAAGVGLAAPQVGVLRRVVVVNIGEEEEEMLELVNPVITVSDGEQYGLEGCLSVPGRYGMVTRPMTVTVEAYDRYGKPFAREGTELIARAFCHELDHLDGKLYVDLVAEWVDDEDSQEA